METLKNTYVTFFAFMHGIGLWDVKKLYNFVVFKLATQKCAVSLHYGYLHCYKFSPLHVVMVFDLPNLKKKEEEKMSHSPIHL